MGGIFSSEKKTTNLTQLDSSTKEAIADVSGSTGSVGVSTEGGMFNRVTLTDQGSIAKAFDFANQQNKQAFDFSGDAIAKAFGFGGQSLAFADEQNARALSVMTDALKSQKQTQTDALTFMQRAGENAMSQMSALARPDAEISDKVLYALGAIGLVLLVFVWRVSK